MFLKHVKCWKFHLDCWGSFTNKFSSQMNDLGSGKSDSASDQLQHKKNPYLQTFCGWKVCFLGSLWGAGLQ